jgi:hypothetical protein
MAVALGKRGIGIWSAKEDLVLRSVEKYKGRLISAINPTAQKY